MPSLDTDGVNGGSMLVHNSRRLKRVGSKSEVLHSLFTCESRSLTVFPQVSQLQHSLPQPSLL